MFLILCDNGCYKGCNHIWQGITNGKSGHTKCVRVVPVHPEDRWLMGMRCQSKLYVDAALPFGCQLAPKIFTALADAIE